MSVTATIMVRLEIQVDGKWGDDCTAKQIKKQAMDSVDEKMIRVCDIGGLGINQIGKVECISVNYKE